MRKGLHFAILGLFIALSFGVPYSLGRQHVNIGEGPDELAHLDHVFFRFTRPSSVIRVGDGLYEPGVAPQGQGHQAPLFYELSAKLLHFVISPALVGPFWDYQAGLLYSSYGEYMGGTRACNVRLDLETPTTSQQSIRYAISFMRSVNAVFFALSVMLTYLAGRLAFRDRPTLALAAAALYAGAPTAVWRSAFVTNDNLVSLLGSLAFLLSLAYLMRGGLILTIGAALVAAASFLTKYNGIVCLVPLLLAIALRTEDSLARRSGRLLAAIGVFVGAIIPETATNLAIEGEPLFSGVLAHEFPWLYRPTTLGHILFESGFVTELLSRFWLEFHNLGILDTEFPLWKVYVWWGLSGLSLAGLGLLAAQRRSDSVIGGRIAVMSIVGFVAAIVLVVHLAASFPLAGGRYLHTMLTPVCVLMTAGLTAVMDVLVGRQLIATTATLVVTIVAALFGITTTYNYQIQKYGSCRSPTSIDVEAGATFGAADIDGDGVDELYSYHRHPGRLFILRVQGGQYVLDRNWTRAFGLQGDVIAFADLTGDKRDDVVIHRAALLGTFFVKAEDVLEHNTRWSYYSDRAVKIYGAWLPHPKLHRSSQLIVGNLDSTVGDELALYSPVNAHWMVLKPVQSPEGLTVELHRHLQFGGSRKEALLLPTPSGTLLGAYGSEQQVLYAGALNDARVRYKFDFPKNQQLLVLNANADGFGDVLTWEEGASVVHVYFASGSSDEYSLSAPVAIDLRRNGAPFSLMRDQEVFAVGTSSQTPDAVGIADKRTGIVAVHYLRKDMESGTVSFDGESVDFGYLRSAERSEEFRPWAARREKPER